MTHKLTEIQAASMVHSYTLGSTLMALSDTYGVSKSTVRYWIKKAQAHGVVVPPHTRNTSITFVSHLVTLNNPNLTPTSTVSITPNDTQTTPSDTTDEGDDTRLRRIVESYSVHLYNIAAIAEVNETTVDVIKQILVAYSVTLRAEDCV